ncbi:sacsin-like [Corticium candelabrum]|uniref:sacsin-like n=1 Tax=Corticium candelabrum TaxID=121492 RepID=UPI002E26F3E7|nr:sacsin-like [Corticium candelabrum]
MPSKVLSRVCRLLQFYKCNRVQVKSFAEDMNDQRYSLQDKLLQKGKKFGQTEPPLCEFLRGILDKYPVGGQILKELIQNADDARAREVNFLLDSRSDAYGNSTLLHPSLAKFQGPALYAQNDALFESEDWSSIQSLNRSVKRENPLKIGKFGIGFNSVYHLTDFPTIVSGNTIGFLDPHKRVWPGESGACYSFDDAKIPQLKSQFEPLNVFRCNVFESTYYNGTLFRFPLRQEDSDSKISSSVWDTAKILDVVFKSFEVDAHLTLLFLKSVEKISLYHWMPGNQEPHIIFSTTLSDRNEVRTKRGELLDCAQNLSMQTTCVENCFRAEVICTYPGEDPVAQSWMVLHRIDNSDSDVQEMADTLHLTPCIGLAVPVGQKTKHAAKLGRVFCFLPLPPTDDDSSMCGLPLHVHGSFSVADDRRSLSWPAEDRQHDPKAQWNYLLLERVLPVAYASLIYICTGQAGTDWDIDLDDIYSAWPVPSNVREHWKQKVLPVLFPLLSSKSILYTDAQGGKWIRAEEAIVHACKHAASSHDLAEQIAKQVMISKSICVVSVPHNVDACLSDLTFSMKRLSPKFVRDNLRGQTSLLSLTRPDQLELLKYILQDKAYSELQGVRLLPVADRTMKRFETRHLTASPVYISTDECPLSLFPGLEKHFVDSSVDGDIYNHLTNVKMTEATQIRQLSSAKVPVLIKSILPLSKSLRIEWPSENPVITDSWLSILWKWLYHHPEILSSFTDCHIIPCPSNKCLVQLASDKPVIFRQQRETNLQLGHEVVEGLRCLGCVVVDSCVQYMINHSEINHYILPPYRVLSCLARLPDNTSDALIQLPLKARQPLLSYLSRILGISKSMSNEEKSVLYKLPLFQLRNSSERTSIELCARIAPSPADLPDRLLVKQQLIKYPNEVESKVLRSIAQSQFLIFKDVIQSLVLPCFNSYLPPERLTLAKYILEHRHLSDSQIFKTLERLQFVPVSSGDLKSPVEVFDRNEEHITKIFSEKPVLSSDRQLEKLIHLSPVRFRKLCSITADELLSLAHEASEGNHEKAKCLISMIAKETWMNIKLQEKVPTQYSQYSSLAAALSQIPWLPCLTKRPPSYPNSIPWKAESIKTSKPSETYVASRLQERMFSIAGSQQVFPDFNVPLGNETVQKLKFATLTYDKILEHLKTAVDCWAAGRVATHDDQDRFGNMMCTILDFLGSAQSQPQYRYLLSQLKQWNSQSIDWIWLNSRYGLVQLSQLVLKSSDCRLEDWRFSTSNFSHLRNCVQLFKDLGMKDRWEDWDLLSLLKEIQKSYSTKCHVPTKNRVQQDLRLSLHVLNLLTRGKDVLPVALQKEVCVPVDSPEDRLELALSSEVTYCDATWLHKVDKHDKLVGNCKLIHRKVPHDTAYALGVPSLIHRLAPSEELDFEVEEFGQHEPLTVRLNNVLKEYKNDSSIFKELIQNADDAGATEVKFLVDWRQHPTSSLLSPGMADCQGPALLAYNNASFKDDDFVNIAKLAAATKCKHLGKIGRFGVGFSSVYHLTEVPSIVSGKYIAIFDPHRKHLGKYIQNPAKPGAKIDFIKTPLCVRFPDQFAPYCGIFGCTLDSSVPYTNTLFRFPFRTKKQAKVSEIKRETCDRTKVKQLIRDLEAVANKLLLFLNHVRSVEVFELRRDHMERLIHVESKELQLTKLAGLPSYQDLVRRCQLLIKGERLSASSPSLDTTAAVIKISKTLPVDKPVQTELYLVCTAIGRKEAMKIASSSKGKEVGCMPLGSVAIQLQQFDESFVPKETKGEVFCGLPLSNLTNLPFHVNGFFAVLANRRGLWWYNSEEHSDRHRSFEPEWNDALIKDAVATALIKGMDKLRQIIIETRTENYYSLWPNSENMSIMWANLVHEFYTKLRSSECSLMCTATKPSSWLPLGRCLFLSDSASTLPHACSIAARVYENFVVIPAHVFGSLQSTHKLLMHSLTNDEAKFISNVFGSGADTTAVTLREKNDLTTELLKRIVIGNESLLQVLKRTKFVPTLPNGVLLRSPQQLLERCDVTSELYPAEYFPLIQSSNDRGITLWALKKLGMKTINDLTWRDCLNRAETVEQLIRTDDAAGERRINAVLQLVTILENKTPDPCASDIARKLKRIDFLPVMPRPNDYPLDKWHADSCRKVIANAETLFFNKYWNVVGSQALVLAAELKLPRTLQPLRSPAVDLILRQLDLVLEALDRRDTQYHEQLVDMVSNIYTILNGKATWNQDDVKRIVHHLQNRPWIYVQNRLLKPHQLSFQCTNQAKPYLYEVPETMRSVRQLLQVVGVKHTFGCKDFIWALQEMQKNSSGDILDEDDLSCVQQIVGVLASNYISEVSELGKTVDVPLLSKDKCLVPATSLMYDDASWMKDTYNADDVTFVDDTIPPRLALNLGVRPIRQELLRVSSSDIPGEPFGQSENLTQRLNNILEDYPKGEEILKELLQNADDAGATVLHVIYDKRPAICVYNDRLFTDKDIEGIQNLGRGSKREEPTLTGKYGIGFNAVYHLTDCPSFVTDNETFCVFDPHCRYVPGATKEKPGRLIHDVNKTFWHQYSDIAHCYQTILGVKLEGGTLFRFPLRTDALAQFSEISNCPVRDKDVQRLFEQFKESAADMLLFLNNICSIQLYVVDERNSISDSFKVSAQIDLDATRKRSELAAAIKGWSALAEHEVRHNEASYCMTVVSDGEKNSRQWLIYQCIGNPYNENFYYASQGALLPRSGVAAPLDEQLDANQSRAYCFLPLPKSVQPKLPVHVNGHFELDSSRRSLWQESRNRKYAPPPGRQRWNYDLIQFVLAPAYCHFLLEARKFVTLQETASKTEDVLKQLDKRLAWFNHLFPRIDSSSETYWQLLSREVYKYILSKKLALFLYIGCLLPSDRPRLSPAQDDRPNPEESRLADFEQTCCRSVPATRWLAIEPKNSLSLRPSYFFEPIRINSSDKQRVNNFILKTILLNIGIPLVASSVHVLRGLQTAADQSVRAQTIEPPFTQPSDQSAQAQTIDPAIVLLFLRNYRKKEVNCKLTVERIDNTILRTVNSAMILLKYVVSKDDFHFDELEGAPLLLTANDHVREFSSKLPVYISRYSSLLPNHSQLFVHPDTHSILMSSYASIEEATVVRPFSLQHLVEHLPSSGIYSCNWQHITSPRYVKWLNSTVDILPTKKWITTLWRYLDSSEGSHKDAMEILKRWPVVPNTTHTCTWRKYLDSWESKK